MIYFHVVSCTLFSSLLIETKNPRSNERATNAPHRLRPPTKPFIVPTKTREEV